MRKFSFLLVGSTESHLETKMMRSLCAVTMTAWDMAI